MSCLLFIMYRPNALMSGSIEDLFCFMFKLCIGIVF